MLLSFKKAFQQAEVDFFTQLQFCYFMSNVSVIRSFMLCATTHFQLNFSFKFFLKTSYFLNQLVVCRLSYPGALLYFFPDPSTAFHDFGLKPCYFIQNLAMHLVQGTFLSRDLTLQINALVPLLSLDLLQGLLQFRNLIEVGLL